MNIKFIEYDGIKGYSRVMYNDVKDADKYRIDVTYDGKDIKALLEYLFEQEQKIDKAIEYIKNEDIDVCTIRYNDIYDTKNELLEILGDKENE